VSLEIPNAMRHAHPDLPWSFRPSTKGLSHTIHRKQRKLKQRIQKGR
jgi:hypothetical protein